MGTTTLNQYDCSLLAIEVGTFQGIQSSSIPDGYWRKQILRRLCITVYSKCHVLISVLKKNIVHDQGNYAYGVEILGPWQYGTETPAENSFKADGKSATEQPSFGRTLPMHKAQWRAAGCCEIRQKLVQDGQKCNIATSPNDGHTCNNMLGMIRRSLQLGDGGWLE